MPEFKKFDTYHEATAYFSNMSLEDRKIYVLHMKAKLTVTQKNLQNPQSINTINGIIAICNRALKTLSNKSSNEDDIKKSTSDYLNNIYARMIHSTSLWNVYNASEFTVDEIKSGISGSKDYLENFRTSYLDRTTDLQRKTYESSLLYLTELERLINIGFENNTFEPINNISHALILDIEKLEQIEKSFENLPSQDTDTRDMSLNTQYEDGVSPITIPTPSMMIKSQREDSESRSSEIIVPDTVYNKGIRDNKVKTKDAIYAVLATNDEGKEYAVAAYTKSKGNTAEARRDLAKATIAAALQNGAAQFLTIAYGSHENMKAAFMVCMHSGIGYVHPKVGDQNYAAYEQAANELKALKAEDKVHYKISNVTVKDPEHNITQCKTYTADIASKMNRGIRSDLASMVKHQQDKGPSSKNSPTHF